MALTRTEQAREADRQRQQAAIRDPRLTTAPTYCNAAMAAMDKLPHEMRSHRPGADQHEQYRSHGTLC
jgi:hypothetical protein